MGGCIHNPGGFSDMMEEHRKKGFSDRMDKELAGTDGKKVREPGWAELGVVAVALGVIAVLFLIFG